MIWVRHGVEYELGNYVNMSNLRKVYRQVLGTNSSRVTVVDKLICKVKWVLDKRQY